MRYAPLGTDDTQQAIVAVEIEDYAFATVATPTGNGWQRIAQFDCWCKYDLDHVMAEFLALRSSPQQGRYELVMRASGGGTGLYQQNEAHFRFHDGGMRSIISFESRYVSTVWGPRPLVEVRRRWFSYDGGPILVEGHASRPFGSYPSVDFAVRDLEVRLLGQLTCLGYRWNEATFRYEPNGDAGRCKDHSPQ